MSEHSPGRAVVVVPPTEIDFGTAKAFGAEIADAFAAGAGAVLVDFSAVTFCDSSGLKVLIHAAKAARALDRAFVVQNPTKGLLRLADLLQASDMLGLPPRPGAGA